MLENIARRIFSSSIALASILLIGRFLGFFREIQIASRFGLSQDSDFAVILLTTPDLFVNLLLAGGLSAALIPEFKRLNGIRKAELFIRCFITVGFLFFIISIVIILFPSLLIFLFAPYYLDKLSFIPYFQIIVMSFAIPIAGATGVTTALLNSDERFLIAASGTLIFNGTLIFSLYIFANSHNQLMLLAMAILTGAALRLSSQAISLKEYFVKCRIFIFPNSYSFTLARRFIQALSATTIVLLVPLILRSALSVYGDGFIAAFNFATKLIELPITIAIGSITTVFFTRVSGQFANEDIDGARESYAQNSILAFLIGWSICIPAIIFSTPLTKVVFGYGQISLSDISLISDLAAIGFITIPFVGISSLATAVLNAQRRTDILFNRTLKCAIIIPFGLIPGLLTNDPEIALLVLPAFHICLAFYLANAAELRISKRQARLAVMGLLFIATIAVAAKIGHGSLDNLSAWIHTAIALIVMSAGITFSGMLVYSFRKGNK